MVFKDVTVTQQRSSRNAKKPHRKKNSISLTKLATETGFSRQSLHTWMKEGMPVDTEANALLWVRTHKPGDSKVLADKSNPADWTKYDWEKFKIELQCERLKFDQKVVEGTVHDRVACCNGLAAARAMEGQVLLGLGNKLAAIFPEIGLKPQ